MDDVRLRYKPFEVLTEDQARQRQIGASSVGGLLVLYMEFAGIIHKPRKRKESKP